MRKFIDIVTEQTSNIEVKFSDGMFIMSVDGEPKGWFTLSGKDENQVSLHSNIDPSVQHKGYGPIAYDWIENWLKINRKLSLVPYDRLSDSAYRLWKKRSPQAVSKFTFKNDNWYSEAGMKKWNMLHESILTKRPSNSSFQEFYSAKGELLGNLVYLYKSNVQQSAPWKVVPAARVNRIWKQYAELGFVRDVKGLESISAQFYKNIMQLYINTEAADHMETRKEDMLEEYFDEEDMEDFVSWLIDCSTGWRISDYGLPRLIELATLLEDCESSEEKLQICDAILNVTHQRSDLASWFVEGGTKSLDVLFNS